MPPSTFRTQTILGITWQVCLLRVWMKKYDNRLSFLEALIFCLLLNRKPASRSAGTSVFPHEVNNISSGSLMGRMRKMSSERLRNLSEVTEQINGQLEWGLRKRRRSFLSALLPLMQEVQKGSNTFIHRSNSLSIYFPPHYVLGAEDVTVGETLL